MRLAFAAGDVGGARALLPVARAAAVKGWRVAAMAHGPFYAEGDPAWDWLSPAAMRQEAFWRAPDAPRLLLYATSVADPHAIRAARAARAAGRPLLHLLDNWSSYAERLTEGEGPALTPEIYAVMDELAREGAMAAGVPEKTLRVVGHPALAALAAEAQSLPGPAPSGPPRLFFPSEPAARDGGGRGYDEIEVSGLLAAALGQLALHQDFRLDVAPHPREDREAVATRWDALAKTHALHWRLVPPNGVRKALHAADGVLGMSSILLYEAWLLGRPALSLQPGLRLPALAVIGAREGVRLVIDPAALPPAVAAMTALIERRRNAGAGQGAISDRLAFHEDAAMRALRLAEALCRTSPLE